MTTESQKAALSYARRRRISQGAALFAFAALPVLDIFRLDLEQMAIILCGGRFGLEKAYLILVCVFVSVGVMIFLARFFGRASCSWACPQTLLNELTFRAERWLNKRLKVGSAKMSARARRILASACLFAICSVLSITVGFFIVSYFVGPTSVAAAVIYPADRPITAKVFAAVSAFIFFDMLWLRHNFCLACIYGYMQAFARGQRALTVRYDSGRRDDCTACEQCVRACYKGLDMRGGFGPVESAQAANSTFFCTNCGDCIKACSKVMGRHRKESILRFSKG